MDLAWEFLGGLSMCTEEIIRFRSDITSNRPLYTRLSRIMAELDSSTAINDLISVMVEFANEAGYNFSKAEIKILLIKAMLIQAKQTAGSTEQFTSMA